MSVGVNKNDLKEAVLPIWAAHNQGRVEDHPSLDLGWRFNGDGGHFDDVWLLSLKIYESELCLAASMCDLSGSE